jgi:DNA-cytosine methyltransferase
MNENIKPTTNNKTLEICCGMGGTRAALTKAGFEIVQSIDFDANAVRFHKEYWHEAEQIDITKYDKEEIKTANIVSAGFPCQPFSSSGYRSGFLHEQGNVFSSIMQLIKENSYELVFLENVTGLISNSNGRTFRIILSELAKLYRHVEWVTTNLIEIGFPQNRDRIIIVAHNYGHPLIADYSESFFHVEQANLFDEFIDIDDEKNLPPQMPLFGTIESGKWRKAEGARREALNNFNLHNFIFEEEEEEFRVLSGRFWARTGKTIFYTSENTHSHNIGASLGNAPTFAIDPKLLSDHVKEKIEHRSNWTSFHSEKFVFRLKPEESLKFFGDITLQFYDSIKNFKAPLAIKYRLIGNMFAPNHAYDVLNHIQQIRSSN